MKDHVSLQERLKDLRVEKGLKLEELAEKTGISKSALASYENEENRNKEINHGNLITLADFYEVSIDYLFCRTENREQINTPLSELHLTDLSFFPINRSTIQCLIYIGGAHVHTQTRTCRTL